MSSNTSNARAYKGSKFWMQNYINISKLNTKLNDEIKKVISVTGIDWRSPLAGEKYDFREYSLNCETDDVLPPILYDIKPGFWKFWPDRQPQWDAIGSAETESGQSTVFLVEAKAHSSEMKTKCGATKGREKIVNAINKYKPAAIEEKVWLDQYYQLANRLVFLGELNSLEWVNVYLVLLNFCKDWSYIDEDEDIIKNTMYNAYEALTGKRTKPSDKIIEIFLDVPTYSEWQQYYESELPRAAKRRP
jgi:hypothetical protein